MPPAGCNARAGRDDGPSADEAGGAAGGGEKNFPRKSTGASSQGFGPWAAGRGASGNTEKLSSTGLINTDTPGGNGANSNFCLLIQNKREVERLDGIEPTTPLWKSGVLPLNYSRKACDVRLYCGLRRVKPAQVKALEAMFSFGRLKGSALMWCYAG